MKIIAKVFIGCIAFIMILGQLVALGESPEDKNRENIKISVRMDLEDAAKRTLNYASTYEYSSFFLIKGEATLFYSGKNAFGVKSTFVIYANVTSDIEKGLYKVTNVRTKK